jgi:SagB-type dehydrogenase family enzyme
MREPNDRETFADYWQKSGYPLDPSGEIDRLISLGVLLEIDVSSPISENAYPPPWNFWGPKVWAMHNETARTRFLFDEDEIWFEKACRSEPAPTRTLAIAHNDKHISLSGYHGVGPMAAVFEARRTTRVFQNSPLRFQKLAELLTETFRVRAVMDAGFFGKVAHKSYPNSGARHEINIYVVSLNVDELERGLYLYDDYEDALQPSGLSVDVEALEESLAHQKMTSASALIFAVCDSPRIAWKYRSVCGYTDMYINVGHCMENAVIYAQSIGLSSWISTAISATSLHQIFHLKDHEFPLSVLAVGVSA